MKELKNCPFCGNEEPFIAIEPKHRAKLEIKGKFGPELVGHISGSRVVCGKYCCKTRSYDTEEKAINAWNIRADGWISVKDRLPEYTVQAQGNRFAVVIANFNGIVTESLYEEGKWKPMHINGCNVEPTHWQPLPKLPEEGE